MTRSKAQRMQWMLVNGYTLEQFEKVEAYYARKLRQGKLDATATPVITPIGDTVLVCRTIPNAIGRLKR